MKTIAGIKEEAEKLFREEYNKAMAQLRNKNIHPKEKIRIARKIAMAKYRSFLESINLARKTLWKNLIANRRICYEMSAP